MCNNWKSVPLKAGAEREFWSSNFSFESATWERMQSIHVLPSCYWQLCVQLEDYWQQKEITAHRRNTFCKYETLFLHSVTQNVVLSVFALKTSLHSPRRRHNLKILQFCPELTSLSSLKSFWHSSCQHSLCQRAALMLLLCVIFFFPVGICFSLKALIMWLHQYFWIHVEEGTKGRVSDFVVVGEKLGNMTPPKKIKLSENFLHV